MSRKIFTLIELLVVVAILSILCGLLLPALSSARNKAHVVSCLNNSKECGRQMLMYADDSLFWIPVGINAGWAYANWHNALQEFGYHGKKGSDCLRNALCRCPRDPEFKIAYWTIDGSKLTEKGGKRTSLAPAEGYNSDGINIASFPSPSTTILFTEGASLNESGKPQFGYFPAGVWSLYLVYLRHQRKATFVWMDGHATNGVTDAYARAATPWNGLWAENAFVDPAGILYPFSAFRK